MKVANKLLHEVAVGEILAIKGTIEGIHTPCKTVVGERTIQQLAWLNQGSRECLEERVAGMCEEVVQCKIAILMLGDYLGHGRVGQETRGLVAKEGREEITKNIGNIMLDMGREIWKPSTKRFAVTDGLGWRDVKTVALHGRDKVRVPEEEDGTSTEAGHCALGMLEVSHVEWVKLEGTEK